MNTPRRTVADSLSAEKLPLFAVAGPGLEPIVATEIAALGYQPTIERGGVAWEGALTDLYQANLWLRTASRVTLRIGEFRARTFPELERYAHRLPWSEFMVPGRAVQLRVSCHKSRLYHERAVAERIERAIEAGLGPAPEKTIAQPRVDDPEDDGAEAQLIVVRFHYDRCTISLDSSGPLLHRRGYRQELARAPLRENLAAALIISSGWQPDSPLIDPFCGSGTIPIEAALIARQIPPGLASPNNSPRNFAFQEWPGYEPELWQEIIDRAAAQIRPGRTTIIGTDRDAGAIRAATRNAERAGVLQDIMFSELPISALKSPSSETGWLITNPPYGVRVGERAPLRNLYAAFGRTVRRELANWKIALVSADRRLERQLGLRLNTLIETRNGGIPITMLEGQIGPE